MLEELKGYDFTDVYQVSRYSNTHLHLFIHSQTFDLRNDKAFHNSLTHILCKLIKDFQGRHLVHVVLVVGQSKSQLHDMLLVIILHDRSNVQKNIDGLILNLLVLVIKQLVKHPENLGRSFILLALSAFLLHELDQGNKLVQ